MHHRGAQNRGEEKSSRRRGDIASSGGKSLVRRREAQKERRKKERKRKSRANHHRGEGRKGMHKGARLGEERAALTLSTFLGESNNNRAVYSSLLSPLPGPGPAPETSLLRSPPDGAAAGGYELLAIARWARVGGLKDESMTATCCCDRRRRGRWRGSWLLLLLCRRGAVSVASSSRLSEPETLSSPSSPTLSADDARAASGHSSCGT